MTGSELMSAVEEPGDVHQVKLVVWDLDDTLWTGTLSEGPVVLDQSRIDLVRALNRRGIVNSICSKNNEDAVRARLEEADLWEEFVFARIDWSPKGPRVAQIIEDAQLRSHNVLFIDDMPTNRGEAGHFAPGIQTAGPDIIGRLLTLPGLSGKDDRGLARLHQYKVLERKLADRRGVSETNEDFLRSCDIRIGMFDDAAAEVERLFELVSRTHQLNFTKRRPDLELFSSMVVDPRHRVGYVRVRDRYGDYGICGFFALSLDDGALVDFLFSCRVLNMGVEQWVYDSLGRPPLTIVGDVVSTLEAPVDWITLDSEGFDVDLPGADDRGGASSPARAQPDNVLMVGGCDLTTTAQYLGGKITTDFSHVGPTGAFIHVGHTDLLRQSAAGITAPERDLVDRIPFLDRGVFQSPAVVRPEYDVLVYSVLTDYTQGLYRHRATGLVVPWYQFDLDVTDPAMWPVLEPRFGREGIDREFLGWFAREFEFLGGISPQRFQENIRWLAGVIPAGARVILLNGAEVPYDNPREPDRYLRHRLMNSALDRVVEGLPNATVCDVRSFVVTEDDLTDSIRHYRRRSYVRMAEEIRAAGATELSYRRQKVASRAHSNVRKFAARRHLQLLRLARRVRYGSPTRRG
jgi:FkbH-like protein